jgi:DNA-binding IclR family transcriptional regulator
MAKVSFHTPGEEHEMARKSALVVLNQHGQGEGLTFDEVCKLTGLVELRARRALQELVLMRVVGRKGKKFFAHKK